METKNENLKIEQKETIYEAVGGIEGLRRLKISANLDQLTLGLGWIEGITVLSVNGFTMVCHYKYEFNKKFVVAIFSFG